MEETSCEHLINGVCGDHSGYIRRIRAKQPTCATCKAAHAEYVRVRRYIKKYNIERNIQ